jgi:hypothetical protein
MEFPTRLCGKLLAQSNRIYAKQFTVYGLRFTVCYSLSLMITSQFNLREFK